MSPFARRAATVAVGVPAVVGWLGLAQATGWVAVIVGPLAVWVGWAGWEYGRLIQQMGWPLRRELFAGLAGLSVLAYGLVDRAGTPLVLAGGVLALALLHLDTTERRRAIVPGAAGLVYLPFLAQFLVVIWEGPSGFGVTLTLLAWVWGYDIGAYLVGSIWGRRRLAPMLSPNKTWEGVAGGMLVALAIGALSTIWLPWGVHGPILALLVSGAAQLGDLLVSGLKRAAGVKDTGTIVPGHGGLLDRVDALLAALPVGAIYLQVVVFGDPLG